jgi:hypothetical protein
MCEMSQLSDTVYCDRRSRMVDKRLAQPTLDVSYPIYTPSVCRPGERIGGPG